MSDEFFEHVEEELPEEQEQEHPLDLFSTDHQSWIAGALARKAEEAGLIKATDDFSWDWHAQFDAEFEAAKAELLLAPDSAEIAVHEIAVQGGEAAAAAAPTGQAADAGFGDGFGDFGGFGFSGFGGGYGGNF